MCVITATIRRRPSKTLVINARCQYTDGAILKDISVCLSVCLCLSIRPVLWYCVETVVDLVRRFSQTGRSIILVP